MSTIGRWRRYRHDSKYRNKIKNKCKRTKQQEIDYYANKKRSMNKRCPNCKKLINWNSYRCKKCYIKARFGGKKWK